MHPQNGKMGERSSMNNKKRDTLLFLNDKITVINNYSAAADENEHTKVKNTDSYIRLHS